MRVKLDQGAFAPTRAHETDAGLDLYTPEDFVLLPQTRITIDTGVHIKLPPNTVGYIRSKSGLLKTDGIITDGVIDEGYSGSIGVTIYNASLHAVMFGRGHKIAQLVIQPVLYPSVKIVDDLNMDSERGSDGFGSTGR